MGFGAFNEVSSFEAGSGADEGEEVGRIHGPPPLLGGLDELEDHGQGGGAGAGAAGDLGPQPDGGEGRLDGVRGAQVDAGSTLVAARRTGRGPASCFRTGLPRRDLPERFGPWQTVHGRFASPGRLARTTSGS